MLKALALHLRNHLEKFYRISYQTGATRADSWIDLEGGIGNLFSYASLRQKISGPAILYRWGSGEPQQEQYSLWPSISWFPKEGVAIHINAYNFPVWGMLEKIAVNLLAGMPAIVKPATVPVFLPKQSYGKFMHPVFYRKVHCN